MNSKADFPGAKSIAASISANAARLSDALDHHMRNSFQPESRKTLRKFQPAEAPVYVCYPDPAALPQIGLAVVRAYVPSVTPAEVAGMLSTLRS